MIGAAPFTKQLEDAYEAVKVYEADIVYVYSDFRTFGRHAGEFAGRDAFCASVADPLLKRGKTVFVTTFTYTTEGRFDVLRTQTKLGALNKWIVTAPGAKRSEHPLFSYSAIGPQADLVENVGKSAFGPDSVFARLHGKKTAFLYVGRPVSMGNTMLHHIEHLCGATYRVHKGFKTEVYRGEKYVGTDYTAFLRRRDVPGQTFSFEFKKAAAAMFNAGLVRQVGNEAELTNVSFHWYDQTADFLTNLFYRDQRVFIGGDFMQY